jgi:hypothetical protein
MNIPKMILALLFLFSSVLSAEDNVTSELSLFDKKDGNFDISEYMSQAYGFVPVPIVITEPSVGYGGGLVLTYLHDNLGGKKSESGRRVPPSISGVLLSGTENGTRMLGAFHVGYWLEDTVRTTSYIGSPNIYMDLYSRDSTIQMNIEGTLFYQNVKFRVGESNLFIGAAYMYSYSDVDFYLHEFEREFGGSTTIASLGLLIDYDTRDNQLSPTSGQLITLKARFYDDLVGSDYTLQNYKLGGIFYNKLSDVVNLNFNIVGENVSGERIAPYLYPFISMRGIPMMRYQGENIVTAQSEVNYNLDARWSLLCFGGIGKAFGAQIAAEDLSFSQSDNIFAGGVGFRYLIAKKFGLQAGIDIAKSKEEETVYIQFGTAWKGF